MTADFKMWPATSSAYLASGQVAVANTNTIVETVSPGSTLTIASFSLTNVTGAVVSVSVSVVPAGGTVDGTHQVVSAFPLAAGDSTLISEVAGSMLPSGTFIAITASAAAAIDYLITGGLHDN